MKFVGVLVLSAYAGMAHAAEFGYTFYGSNLSVKDPDGATESISYLSPFNGFYADSIRRDLRYKVDAFTDKVVLNSGVGTVGQEVKYQGIGLSLQRRFRMASTIKPWLGVGADYVDVQYSQRHTKDKDGFLDTLYPDRAESAVNLTLNAANYWRFNRSWDMGVTAKAGFPVSSDATFLSIGFSVVYK